MNAHKFHRTLRYWTFHCVLNALPSFIIAFVWLKLRSPTAVGGMLAAIGTFILLYATFTSLYGPFTDPQHVFSRALNMGLKIRAWVSSLSLLLIWDEMLAMFTPDFWSGFLSFYLLNCAADLLSPGDKTFNLFSPTQGKGFFSVYATTMLEGLILSFLLLLISFFAVIILQAKERRKFLREARLPK